jgi:hypothetical protein
MLFRWSFSAGENSAQGHGPWMAPAEQFLLSADDADGTDECKEWQRV